ncbi:hypothetical protein G7075_07450 [Phycicoccus sp. HDW14]|uniref:hypothetical protein n=1 Tax=Phycicoccus sp. HDW14 TaxID=2714941 RepID=UPI001408CA7C|nr:hypothetical protein [Phycicoccus sp. HDW14]QIM21006.1 hypothetical protein G7075_07450 [Phycicoccus sp. HDW14]
MLDTMHPRDLVMIGAVFGLATVLWAGWAQEAPPRAWVWRAVLGLLSVAGLALAAWSATLAVRHWGSGTAIEPGSRAFTVYLVVFWVEVLVAGVAGVLLARTGHSDLLAPLVLLVVGVHFVALAGVFGQPVLHLAAGLLSGVAVLAALLPSSTAAHSFWCGVLGAPVFLGLGLWSAVRGAGVLAGA